jgi:HSP20 family molecular chaperone IbpA
MAQNALVRKEKQSELAAPEQVHSAVSYTPRADIIENQDEMILYADLPGVEPGDVDVRFENGELVIHGKCAPRQEGADYLLSEYGIGDFYRAFTIGEAIDNNKISAELKQGVLTVHLPKSEKVKPKRIAVKSE